MAEEEKKKRKPAKPAPYLCGDWYPDIDDIQSYSPDADDGLIRFYSWIIRTGVLPSTVRGWTSRCMIVDKLLGKEGSPVKKRSRTGPGKILISYDEYDDFCEKMASLPDTKKCRACPTTAELSVFENMDAQAALPFYVWVVETYTKPRTMEEESIIKKINHNIIDGIEFMESFDL